ncbi:unnamed protein product [Caretta caretta]
MWWAGLSDQERPKTAQRQGTCWERGHIRRHFPLRGTEERLGEVPGKAKTGRGGDQDRGNPDHHGAVTEDETRMDWAQQEAGIQVRVEKVAVGTQILREEGLEDQDL